MLVGLTAGRLAGIQIDLKILKFSTDCIVRFFTVFNKGTIVLPILGIKYILRHVVEVRKSGTPCFSC